MTHTAMLREIIGELEELLAREFHITATTLQGECSRCTAGEDVFQNLRHQPRQPVLCSHDHGSPGHSH